MTPDDRERWRAELLSIIEDARKEQSELLAHLDKKLPLGSDVQAKLRSAVVKIEKTIEGAQAELKKIEAMC